MLVFLSILVCVATALFIGAPLWRSATMSLASSAAGRGSSPDEARRQLQQRRDTSLLALKELEFDHSMNKIEESGYARLRAELTSEAAAVLRQLDALDATRTAASGGTSSGAGASQASAAALEAQIEAEVLIARARRRRADEKTSPVAAAEAAVSGADADAGTHNGWRCAQCGRVMAGSDRFCASCGAGRTSQTSLS